MTNRKQAASAAKRATAVEYVDAMKWGLEKLAALVEEAKAKGFAMSTKVTYGRIMSISMAPDFGRRPSDENEEGGEE